MSFSIHSTEYISSTKQISEDLKNLVPIETKCHAKKEIIDIQRSSNDPSNFVGNIKYSCGRALFIISGHVDSLKISYSKVESSTHAKN